jgi:hypothetical protein
MTSALLDRPHSQVSETSAGEEPALRPGEFGVIKHWCDEIAEFGAENFRGRVLRLGLTVIVSLRYEPAIADELYQRIEDFYEQLPQAMRDTVNHVVISSWAHPTDSDVRGIAQWDAGGGRMIFWTDGQPHLNVSQLVFDHEAAHLACRGAALPAGWEARWQQARDDDRNAFGRRRNLLLRRHCAEERYCRFSGGLTRQFIPATGWLTSYAAQTEKLAEDFAEAVSFYLLNRRHGNLYRHGKPAYQVYFRRLAPHRRRVILDWFATTGR